jgi:hypothetical protein
VPNEWKIEKEIIYQLFEIKNDTEHALEETRSKKEQTRLHKCIALLNALDTEVILNEFDGFKALFNNRPLQSQKYNENYILRTLLGQASTDLNIIQQALQQRRLQRRLQDNQLQFTHQGYVLHIADLLASKALEPAIRKQIVTANTSVLTYLEDRIEVRLVPYKDIMLLSIPYGVINEDCSWFATDYLAIPHEIGHFLYWFKKDLKTKSIREELIETIKKEISASDLKNNGWLFQWLEEIFADAYGCAVAGPIIVLSFQELLASGLPTALDHADDKHPVPAIRPLIQAEILRKMGLGFEKESDLLDKNWEQWMRANRNDVDQNDPVRSRKYQIAGRKHKLLGETILKRLSPVIEAVVDLLKGKGLLPPDKTGTWSGDWNHDLGLPTLYKSFTTGRFLNNFSSVTAVTNEIEEIKPSTRQKRMSNLPKNNEKLDEWIEQILFHGWSTEGPEGSHGGL